MSRAVECDSCGDLVRHDEAVTLGRLWVPVHGAKNGAVESWDEVEICQKCLDRPVREVLVAACAAIELPPHGATAPAEAEAP